MKTTLDIFIARKVQEIREKRELTREQLDIKLGFAAGSAFVGHVETDKRTKYNLYHLNELARILECSIADFFPFPYDEENSLEKYRAHVAKKKQQNSGK
ncbi:helix-turn-helix domain-containing protein [Butyricimonas virosa]|uniref:helix-turn-helix domain-containing protein n=1 Tax=Butyricimonas virosa TaxID=544645 RepID=UPI0024303051|nr:XRE family transcriptional regulator [Butyricimonas virosa]